MKTEPITADNWGYAPYNRWSFQNVQALFPTVRIRRGSETGPIFGMDPRDLNALSYPSVDGVERTVWQMMDDSYTDSFLVVKNGTILCEQYFNNMAADSHHLMNSVTKSFVGVLVGIVADQNMLDIEQRLVEHIPEFADTAFAETTVRTALDMSAAVAFGEDYADSNADFWVESSVVGWRPALVKSGAPKTLYEYAASLKLTEQVEGEKYHYRTVLTDVLGMVLERATGKSLQELLRAEIWSRLGPEQDACIVVDREGFPYVGAGMSACTRDLARFGQMMVQQGSYNDQQIVPAEWISDIRYADAHAKKLFAAGDYAELMPGGHYRNQFWVSDSERGVLLAVGIHGQTIHMNISTGTVIVKFSSHPEPVELAIFQDTFAAMDAISEIV